jgi:hypothetical protein
MSLGVCFCCHRSFGALVLSAVEWIRMIRTSAGFRCFIAHHVLLYVFMANRGPKPWNRE